MKYVDMEEFRDSGYLQELNRLFLHPLGMAMSVSSKGEDKVVFTGIIDSRDQADGCIFDERIVDSRVEEFEDKALYVRGEWESRCAKRMESLGYEIQPIKRLEDGLDHLSVDIQPKE